MSLCGNLQPMTHTTKAYSAHQWLHRKDKEYQQKRTSLSVTAVYGPGVRKLLSSPNMRNRIGI